MKRRKTKSGYSVVVTLKSGEVQVGEPFPTEAQAKSYRKYLRRGKGRWSNVSSIKVLKSNRRRTKRCWKGYKPVKGKRPYSKGSCRRIKNNARRKPRASDLARWRAEAKVRDDKSRGIFWTSTKDYMSGPKYDPARWDSRGVPINTPDWYRASLKSNRRRGLRRNPSESPSDYYYKLLRAGVPMDNHESDLYVKDTPTARAILADWPFGRLGRFRNNINGEIYIDIPFAYAPYWEKKVRR
jgi:hypothetical protein